MPRLDKFSQRKLAWPVPFFRSLTISRKNKRKTVSSNQAPELQPVAPLSITKLTKTKSEVVFPKDQDAVLTYFEAPSRK